MTALVLVAMLALPAPTEQNAERRPEAFLHWAAPLAGVYETNGGEHLIVTPHASLELLSLFWLERGDVRGLKRAADSRFEFGHGLYPSEPAAGLVEFVAGRTGHPTELRIQIGAQPALRALRRAMQVDQVTIEVGDEASLAGLLVTPAGAGPFPAAVLIPSGSNDRYQHWRIAMALLTRGIGSLVYDARLAGHSTGAPLPSHYYTRSLVRARDAAAAAAWLRSHDRIDEKTTGVVGWSQGGWLGAIVAGADSGVSFYVNIAGNLNPGWQQQRHARLSDLRYEGFSEPEIAAAGEYLDAYFGVMLGSVPWRSYAAGLTAVRDTRWYRWFDEQSFSVSGWASPEAALKYAELERDNLPERDLLKVTQPALGVYFEFDESSPPDSAEIFLRGLLRGGNSDITLRTIPNTTHEAWVVDDYLRKADSPPSRLAPDVFRFVADWVANLVKPAPPGRHGR